MNRMYRLVLALVAVAVVHFALAGTAHAAAARADVVRVADIQASIDQKTGGEAAQREQIRTLLQRPDVRRIAGAAGLSVERANAAVGQLSGAELKDIAARADEVNATTGGRETVTIGVTTLIIILLLILILR